MNRVPISFWSVLLPLLCRGVIRGLLLEKWFLWHGFSPARKNKLIASPITTGLVISRASALTRLFGKSGRIFAGAAVCLADDAVRSSPELLRPWLIPERVTIGFDML